MLKKTIIASCLLASLGVSASDKKEPFSHEKKVYEVLNQYAQNSTDQYFIQLRNKPLALQGEETKTALGKLNINSSKVKELKHVITQQQQAFSHKLRKELGALPKITNTYKTVFNGFSISLTEKQAEEVATMPDVLKVIRQVEYQLYTDIGPKHIGADKVWNSTNGLSAKGEGVVLGILDSGVNTDHPSFAATGADNYTAINPNGPGNFLGDCKDVENLCNDKLIGVFSYSSITEQYGDIRPAVGEDYNGHGSHVASTAGGNVLHNIPYYKTGEGDVSDGVPIDGSNVEEMSGVAPHANIISFQVCTPNGGCDNAAMLQAVEDAVENGVDVINMSIGPGGQGPHPWDDALQLAFLSAHEAGVFVAVAAGNSGSGSSTVGNLAPWTTVVANATHGRTFSKSLSAGPDASEVISDINGAGGIDSEITADVIYAGDVSPDYATCDFFSFFPIFEFENKIVICDRGETALQSKADTVQRQGAIGVVIRNVAGSNTELHSVSYPIPGILINQSDGEELLAWAQTALKPELTIHAGEASVNSEFANIINFSSSRGPYSEYPELLVPHIAAPGTDIFAAYADEQPFSGFSAAPSDYNFLTGTSMASPHIAGAGVLIKQLHPDWTSSEIQSAMMLTANSNMTRQEDGEPASIWDRGAGMVRVDQAVSAGLIMNITPEEFLAANPKTGGNIKELNAPQLLDSACEATCSWSRTFKATQDGTWHYDASELGAGIASLKMTPAEFTVAKGDEITVSFEASLSSNSGKEWINGNVKLLPKSLNQPSLVLPLRVKKLDSVIPDLFALDYYWRDSGVTLGGFKFGEPSGITFDAEPLIQATSHTLELMQDSNENPFDDLTDGVAFFLINGQDSNQPITIRISDASNADTDLFVGIDSNGDNIPQLSERECVSASEKNIGETCTVSGNSEGNYWVMVQNFEGSLELADKVVIDVVKATKDTILPVNATTVGEVAPFSPVTIDLNWQGSLNENVNYYGKINTYEQDISSGNLTHINDTQIIISQSGEPVKISTENDEVTTNQATNMVIEFAPNSLAEDIELTIDIKLAEYFKAGLTDLNLSQNGQNIQIKHNLIQGADASIIELPITLIEPRSGTFEHQYTITSSRNSATINGELLVTNPNSAPSVTISAQNSIAKIGDDIMLTATVVDKENNDVSIRWRQISGKSVAFNASNDVLNFTPDSAGTYTFEAIASDGEFTTKVSKAVTVEKNSDGGSMYYLLLLAMPFLLRRRM